MSLQGQRTHHGGQNQSVTQNNQPNIPPLNIQSATPAPQYIPQSAQPTHSTPNHSASPVRQTPAEIAALFMRAWGKSPVPTRILELLATPSPFQGLKEDAIKYLQDITWPDSTDKDKEDIIASLKKTSKKRTTDDASLESP
jgi:hypothetical protein